MLRHTSLSIHDVRLPLVQEAKDQAERERAEKAERRGAEKSGPFVDPQAAQESEELLRSLSMMGGGLLNNNLTPPGEIPSSCAGWQPLGRSLVQQRAA